MKKNIKDYPKNVIVKYIIVNSLVYVLPVLGVIDAIYNISNYDRFTRFCDCLILTMISIIIYLKYWKSIRKVINLKCDAKKYAEIMEILYKVEFRKKKKECILLNTVNAYLLTGEYEKTLNIINKINESNLSKKYVIRYNMYLSTYYCATNQKEKFFESFDKTLNLIKNSKNGQRLMKNVNIVICKASMENNYKLEKELWEILSLEITVMYDKVIYNYNVGCIDIIEGNLEKGKSKLAFVIQHGNSLKYVNMAKEKLKELC